MTWYAAWRFGDAVADYHRLNKNPWILKQQFQIPKVYDIVSSEVISAVLNAGDWEAFYKRQFLRFYSRELALPSSGEERWQMGTSGRCHLRHNVPSVEKSPFSRNGIRGFFYKDGVCYAVSVRAGETAWVETDCVVNMPPNVAHVLRRETCFASGTCLNYEQKINVKHLKAIPWVALLRAVPGTRCKRRAMRCISYALIDHLGNEP